MHVEEGVQSVSEKIPRVVSSSRHKILCTCLIRRAFQYEGWDRT